MEDVQAFILSMKRGESQNQYTESPQKNKRNLPVLSRDLRYSIRLMTDHEIRILTLNLNHKKVTV